MVLERYPRTNKRQWRTGWGDIGNMRKNLILKVLERYQSRKVDFGSKSQREQLAAEIEAVLLQNEQIIEIERELYRGEG